MLIHNMLATFQEFISRWGIMIILIAFAIGVTIISNISQKKRQKKTNDLLNELQVGDQIKTVGGIIGIITSFNDPKNQIIIKTGDNEHPTYIAIDKMAVYAVEENSKAGKSSENRPTKEDKEKQQKEANKDKAFGNIKK